MKHRPLLFLVLPLLLLAVTLGAVHMPSGTENTASAAQAQLYLDLDGSDGWCTDIDNTDTVNVGEQHQAAICLVGATNAPSDFDIVVQFNNQLNSCTNPYSNCGDAGTARDGNPDLVAQGSGFNCSLGGLKCPYCNVNYSEDPPLTNLSEAFITCGTTTDPGTLSGPEAIAIITWTVAAGGTDTLTFGAAAFSDFPGEGIVSCPSANCHGATVTKSGNTPQPTATSTRTPTATATPNCGRVGQEPCPTSTPTAKSKTRTPTPEATGTPEVTVPTSAPPPPPPPSGGQQPIVVTPPGTGTGSSGIGWTGILMWTLAGGAASLVLGGGLYLRRVANR